MPSEVQGIYLTFDDGPDPRWTPTVLELLGRYGARATFFVLGHKAVRHPELLRAVWLAGHSIGSHGFSHRRLLLAGRSQVCAQLEQADAAIAEATGTAPRLLRPPYGHFSPALLRTCREAGKQIVLWDTNSQDYKARSSGENVARKVLTHVRPGSIVLLHDGHSRSGQTIAALETVLPELYRRGFRCLPLAQSATGKRAPVIADPAPLRLPDFAFHRSSKQSSVAA